MTVYGRFAVTVNGDCALTHSVTPSLCYHLQSRWEPVMDTCLQLFSPAVRFCIFSLRPLVNLTFILCNRANKERLSEVALHFLLRCLNVTRVFCMNSRTTESWFSLLRYTYLLKVHQANAPFSFALLHHFNAQSSEFGSKCLN